MSESSKRTCARCGCRAYRVSLVRNGKVWSHRTRAACIAALDRAARQAADRSDFATGGLVKCDGETLLAGLCNEFIMPAERKL